MSTPTPEELFDRALGVVLAAAAGDALGAPYEASDEAQVALASGAPIEFTSSEDWAQGEWTDDTAMALPILEALSQGFDLRSSHGLSYLSERWLAWFRDGGKGIGPQTHKVLTSVVAVQKAEAEGSQPPRPLSETMAEMAKLHHEDSGRSAGNGALMRVGPLALGYLREGAEAALADAARKQALLTHHEPDAGDAAALWSLAVRQAVLTGEYDLTHHLHHIPEERRGIWEERIRDAHENGPEKFVKNYWVVSALQCAVIANRSGEDVKGVLEAAVRGLGDTDTVAAIAGQLAGARFGAGDVPEEWRRQLHGWDRYTAHDIERMVKQTSTHYQPPIA